MRKFNKSIDKIYVVRYSKGINNDRDLPIKPCRKCLKIANKLGIRIKVIK